MLLHLPGPTCQCIPSNINQPDVRFILTYHIPEKEQHAYGRGLFPREFLIVGSSPRTIFNSGPMLCQSDMPCRRSISPSQFLLTISTLIHQIPGDASVDSQMRSSIQLPRPQYFLDNSHHPYITLLVRLFFWRTLKHLVQLLGSLLALS